MSWHFRDKIIDKKSPEIINQWGFVYVITNLLEKKKYIGRKNLWRKNKQNKQHTDWMDYYGSDPKLEEDVAKHGKENFKRSIYQFEHSFGNLKYTEAKLIFLQDALWDPDYYNTRLRIDIYSNHLTEPY